MLNRVWEEIREREHPQTSITHIYLIGYIFCLEVISGD